jgi:ribosomal protein L44E
MMRCIRDLSRDDGLNYTEKLVYADSLLNSRTNLIISSSADFRKRHMATVAKISAAALTPLAMPDRTFNLSVFSSHTTSEIKSKTKPTTNVWLRFVKTSCGYNNIITTHPVAR